MYYFHAENVSYKYKTHSHVFCEPRIEHLIVRGIAKVVKQSPQLVNLEIASPAATFI